MSDKETFKQTAVKAGGCVEELPFFLFMGKDWDGERSKVVVRGGGGGMLPFAFKIL